MATAKNGIIDRFFRSLKEECVWQHHFQTFEEARQQIRTWLRWYEAGPIAPSAIYPARFFPLIFHGSAVTWLL
ncbi:MAG: hypothetical protein C4293_08790 [Nitrospiraceae bacterium]